MTTAPASTTAATTLAQGQGTTTTASPPAPGVNSSPPSSPTFSDKLLGSVERTIGKLAGRPGLEKQGEVRKISGKEAARREKDAQRGRTEEGSTTATTGAGAGGAQGGGAGRGGGQQGEAGMEGGGLETVQ